MELSESPFLDAGGCPVKKKRACEYQGKYKEWHITKEEDSPKISDPQTFYGKWATSNKKSDDVAPRTVTV